MHQQRTSTSKRAGFTLVELMVVILIISILSALLTMAVSRGIATAKRTRNRTEIAQLAAAVDTFKAAYRVDYIPSRIYLSETGNYTAGTADSLAYLQRLWPKLSFPVDWNGNGKIDPASDPNSFGDAWLEGDQCLVFFLGGLAVRDSVTLAPGCIGFSTNPVNPMAHLVAGGAATAVRGPFYEFDTSRLAYLPHGTFSTFNFNLVTPYASYLDTYGASDGKGTAVPGSMPYLYFSTFQGRNRYTSPLTGISDCTPCIELNLLARTVVFQQVWPYAQGDRQYLNPTGFQIISAGADQKFGSGTSGATSYWTPATAASSLALDRVSTLMRPNSRADLNLKGAGADDQSNFYDSPLGTPSVN